MEESLVSHTPTNDLKPTNGGPTNEGPIRAGLQDFKSTYSTVFGACTSSSFKMVGFL